MLNKFFKLIMIKEGTALFLAFYPNDGHKRIRNGTLELLALADVSEKYFSFIDQTPASHEEER